MQDLTTNNDALHLRILHALNHRRREAYMVGGCVRDRLLGLEPKDIDIATSATPEEVLELFPNSDLVGAHFGVVIVKEGDTSIEVATFRKDGAYSDSRHPDFIEFTTAAEDAQRRDFTVNALFMTDRGTIHDFVGGRYDLARKVIRCVGNPEERIAEDALRMLRAVRFACQLGFTIERHTWRAILGNAHRIQWISVERIRDEFSKILRSGLALYGISLLQETGLLQHVMPEVLDMRGVEQNPVHHPEGDVYTHTLSLLEKLPKGCSLTLALAALLHDIGKPATAVLKDGQNTFHGHEERGAMMAHPILSRLKYPNEVIDVVENHVAQHMRFRVAADMKREKLYRFLRQPNFAELLELHRLDAASGSGNMENAEFVEGILASVPPEKISPPRLITGDDLIAFGIPTGPIYKTILEAIETEQLEGRVADRAGALRFLMGREWEGKINHTVEFISMTVDVTPEALAGPFGGPFGG